MLERVFLDELNLFEAFSLLVSLWLREVCYTEQVGFEDLVFPALSLELVADGQDDSLEVQQQVLREEDVFQVLLATVAVWKAVSQLAAA